MKKDLEENKELHRRMNPITMERLIECGSNPDKIHCFINVFHVFAQNDLNDLVLRLEEISYAPATPELIREAEEVEDQEYVEYWLVEAEKLDTLSIGQLHLMTDECVDAAFGLNAVYDGWYSQAVSTIH